jgi:prevent-host-death family protein
MNHPERTITVTEFKAKCLKLLDNLDSQGLIVTKRGRPVARVLPVTLPVNVDVIGSMRDKIRVKGDLFTTGVRWDAQS